MTYTAQSAIRRADQVFYEFLSEKTPLEHGIAFINDEFPEAAQDNSLREVLVESAAQCAQAWEQSESFFAERGLTCGCWVPCAVQPPDVLEPFLSARGFAARSFVAMQLDHWLELPTASGLRVLPARAMRQVFRELHEDAGAAQLAERRMDYAHFDMYVAVAEDRAVGRGGLLQAGEVGLIRDLYVVPDFRRRKVGSTLLSYFLEMARRLMLKILVVKVDQNDSAGHAFISQCGFLPQGELIEFYRRS